MNALVHVCVLGCVFARSLACSLIRLFVRSRMHAYVCKGGAGGCGCAYKYMRACAKQVATAWFVTVRASHRSQAMSTGWDCTAARQHRSLPAEAVPASTSSSMAWLTKYEIAAQAWDRKCKICICESICGSICVWKHVCACVCTSTGTACE